MCNRLVKLLSCSAGAGAGDVSGRLDNSFAFLSKQHDKAIGNSICYIRPNPSPFSSGDATFSDDDATLMTFRSVSGATVSANSSATASTSLDDSLQHSTVLDSSASFESSGSFTSTMVPHQHHHKNAPSGFFVGSPMKRGLSLSPMVGVQSPCDFVLNGDDSNDNVKKLRRNLSHDGCVSQKKKPSKLSLKKVLSRAFFSIGKKSILKKKDNGNARVSCGTSMSGELGSQGVEGEKNNYLDDGGGDNMLMVCENLHWAQGRGGEDRMHIVICENHGWAFVGIYDGFNGPDATDYLLNNMFYAVHDELKGLLCSHKSESLELDEELLLSDNGMVNGGYCCYSGFEKEKYPIENEKLNLDFVSKSVEGMDRRRNSKNEEVGMMECEGGDEKVEIAKEGVQQVNFSHTNDVVLQALSEALRKTEEAFLKITDEMITHNSVLAMMGSCVLVMLMKGEDVYLMNVGDSRAVLATKAGNSLQLTMEHSTHVKEEVNRIIREHPDDPSAVTKGRVKGFLNVTRAFGAGFLKQPKQNNAILETFKVSYIGESPYITCSPSLHHHRLNSNDKFLILSSDGLYQYFTNEEAVAKVKSFITMFPDRDPAQLLIAEALSRAAKKAGLKLHELLDISQGERRLYHDDISIVIISMEGKIWRSSV